MRIVENGCGSGDPGGNRTRDNLIKSPHIIAHKVADFLGLLLMNIQKLPKVFRQFPVVNSNCRHNYAKVISTLILFLKDCSSCPTPTIK